MIWAALFGLLALILLVCLLILDAVSVKQQAKEKLPDMRSLSRKEKKQRLCTYYCGTMVEDPIDGSAFDCAILDAINGVNEWT